MTKPRTGGEILVDALRLHGADTVFGVPGESYLAALDALGAASNAIRFIVCRQEGGAAFMADAYGKLTGKPGICFVTRGPGACNASIGVHTAFQDSTPMVLLVGQVGRSMREREAFQEVEFRQMFAPLAKWVAEVDDARRLPEFISRAFHTALSGRPGPVVLALPEDMLSDVVETRDARLHRPSAPAPKRQDMTDFRERLAAAARPLIIVGGPWSSAASAAILEFADAWDLPIASSLRCQDYVDNHHACYVGDVGIAINPALRQRIEQADLIVALGPRLGEMTTQGYTLLQPPVPTQGLIHIHPGAEELGRVYAADQLIHSTPDNFLALAAELTPPASPPWRDWRRAARAAYEASLRAREQPGPVDMGAVMAHLADALPEDAIICNGAGNYTGWVHKHRQFRRYRSQLAPTSGAMGYGVPAAIAAKLTKPSRTVVAFAGDGCFMMNGQELATAAQYGLAIVVLVINNGMYGTIRMHQARHYPERSYGVDLVNPDFAALAAAYGAHSEVVKTTADFPAAWQRAMASDRLALIELRVSPEAMTTTRTLSEITAMGRKEQAAAAEA